MKRPASEHNPCTRIERASSYQAPIFDGGFKIGLGIAQDRRSVADLMLEGDQILDDFRGKILVLKAQGCFQT